MQYPAVLAQIAFLQLVAADVTLHQGLEVALGLGPVPWMGQIPDGLFHQGLRHIPQQTGEGRIDVEQPATQVRRGDTDGCGLQGQAHVGLTLA